MHIFILRFSEGCSMNLIESMSAEVEASAKGTVLLPLGSLEQHGTEAPLGCDGIVAEAICRLTGERTGCSVLPCLYFGNSHCHTGFPGTFSLSLETYSALLSEIASEAFRNGFQRLIMLSGHGGNRRAAETALGKLPPPGRAQYLGYWELPGASEEEERLFGKTGYHITTSEVSMVWHILGREVPGAFAGRYPPANDDISAYSPEKWRETYPLGGVGGDMGRVSTESGKTLLEFLVRTLSNEILIEATE
jgi:creatinine amidohydrolase